MSRKATDDQLVVLHIGLAGLGSVTAGTLGLIGSVLRFLANDYHSSALFLLTSAVAFGLLANSLYRE